MYIRHSHGGSSEWCGAVKALLTDTALHGGLLAKKMDYMAGNRA